MFHSIYIAGAEPGSGKSIVVLGMMEMLRAITPKTNFFRPVIGENNGHDPLIHLISRRYNLELDSSQLYGCTQETARHMVAEGRYDELMKLILGKYRAVQENSDIVLCAGTDFTGASSALELDFNAELANHFDSLLLPVVKGCGRTAEEIADAVQMLEAYLETSQHCELLAAFANRVPPDQIDTLNGLMKETRWPFFSLPERFSLERPTVGEIARELRFDVLYSTPQSLTHEVSHYKVAAMQVQDFLVHLKNCSMVITPGDRSDIILGTLAADVSGAYPMVSGMILSGGQQPSPEVRKLLEGLDPLRLPILLSPWDTFETALKVNEVEGMILPSDDRKIAVALGLMESCQDCSGTGADGILCRYAAVTPADCAEQQSAHDTADV